MLPWLRTLCLSKSRRHPRLLLRAVLCHPPFHWVSCSIWKAFVYGRRDTEFSILPRGPLVDPVHALEGHLLPMHCSVTSLVNHATGHVCCFWTLCSASQLLCLCSRSQPGSCLAHPSRSGCFLPNKPSRGLITLPHSSPGAMVIFSPLHLLLEPMSQFPQKSAWLLIGITLNL